MSFKKSLEILQPKMLGRVDSIFYDGEIAVVEKPNGTKLLLMATGDIDFRIDNDRYRSTEDIIAAGWNDALLYTANKEDKIEWRNNNWFEVLICKSGENEWSDWGLDMVRDDYDSGIDMLRVLYYDDDV